MWEKVGGVPIGGIGPHSVLKSESLVQSTAGGATCDAPQLRRLQNRKRNKGERGRVQRKRYTWQSTPCPGPLLPGRKGGGRWRPVEAGGGGLDNFTISVLSENPSSVYCKPME